MGTFPSMSASTATPIGDYGLIGDTRSSALVSSWGSIDWMCVPTFDSAPVFASLVAGPAGGSFSVAPVEPSEVVDRRYAVGGTVLEVHWRTADAEVRLRDAMVADVAGRLLPATVLVRHVECFGSPTDVRVRLQPRRDGTRRPRHDRRAGADVFTWGDLALAVCADRPLPGLDGEEITVRVPPGQPLTIVMTAAQRHPAVFVPPGAALQAVAADQRWWADFADRVDDGGPWRHAVVRSAITLKLLTFSPSGAPVAAPTTSLPEVLGGEMNWDYRYAWFRDAALGVGTFLALGLDAEARQFFYWLWHATRRTRPRIPPALTLFGNPILEERTADWPGYADSRPVRIGNVVSDQRQLDVYGFVLDAANQLSLHGHDVYADTWRALRGAADHVADTWREPGAGIWEQRGDPQQFVHSKMLGWLALDRAQQLGRRRRESLRRLQRWELAKQDIHAELLDRGFDDQRGTFVRAYGSSDLDGSLLLLPLVGMEPLESPRVSGTIDAVRRELHAGGPFFYRHPDGDDGAFLAVSFWMVQALAKIGRVDEAGELLDQLVDLNPPLGLLSEEVDPSTGRLIGNHPQALSHAALLQAVLAMGDARG